MPSRKDLLYTELFEIIQTLDLRFTPPGALDALSSGNAIRKNKYKIIDTMVDFRNNIILAGDDDDALIKKAALDMNKFILEIFPRKAWVLNEEQYTPRYTEGLETLIDRFSSKKSWLDKLKCWRGPENNLQEDTLEALNEVIKDQSKFDDRAPVSSKKSDEALAPVTTHRDKIKGSRNPTARRSRYCEMILETREDSKKPL